jgi:general secretion pathway protein G
MIASALALLCLGCSTTTQQGVRTSDIMEALNRFEADCGRFPTTAEGLSALVKDPGAAGWKGPYWQGDFRDRWGSTWGYENGNGDLFLSSPKGKIVEILRFPHTH